MSLQLFIPKMLKKCYLNFIFCIKRGQIVKENFENHQKYMIDHTYKALEVLYENYVIFIAHLGSLAQIDLQVLKQAEIEVLAKK